jgi:hypothetical protein
MSYMVLRHLDDPDLFHFARPVVVLMNAKCFSVFFVGGRDDAIERAVEILRRRR